MATKGSADDGGTYQLGMVLDENQPKCVTKDESQTIFWTAVGGKKIGINVLLYAFGSSTGTSMLPSPPSHDFSAVFRVIRADNGMDVSFGSKGEANIATIGSADFKAGRTEPVKATLRLSNISTKFSGTNFYIAVDAPVGLSDTYLGGQLGDEIEVKTKPNMKQKTRPVPKKKRASVRADRVFVSLNAFHPSKKCIGCHTTIPSGIQLKKSNHTTDCKVKDYVLSHFTEDGVAPLSASHSNGRCVFCGERMEARSFHIREFHLSLCPLMSLLTQPTGLDGNGKWSGVRGISDEVSSGMNLPMSDNEEIKQTIGGSDTQMDRVTMVSSDGTAKISIKDWTNARFTVETAPGTTVGALKATIGEKVDMLEDWFILKHSSIHLEDDRLVSAIRFRGGA
mmetsp:Transcript_20357/g.44456  ORF Transcript_20357/g.44456 Transcript_20357/m.44456 type:complete len:395 (+) Transcript_20357:379-1563(+)